MEEVLIFNIGSENLEHCTHCAICNSSSLTPVSKVQNSDGLVFFQTSFCEDCSFVFRSIRPDKAWFSRAFEQREMYQKARNYSAINASIEEERYNRYYRLGGKLVQYFGQDVANTYSIMDLGCGTGSGLLAFQAHGFKCFGLDEDNTRAQYGIDKGLDISVTSWETYVPEKKFDIITCLHSVEHFHYPAALLEKIKDWLNPGGKIVIEVPNFKHFVCDWTDSLYLAHMANYTPHGLVRLAEKAGLQFVDRIHHYETEEKNNENLCMLFDVAEQSGSNAKDGISNNDELNRSEVLKKYSLGLPADVDETKVVTFRVPFINDISLCYKNSAKISDKLSENLHMRSIELQEDMVKVF